MDNWKILLVDDDWDDYLLTKEMLRDQLGDRFELFLLASGDDFAKSVCSNPNQVDVALVEYRFDSVGGLEVIREISQTCPEMPCILFTDWPQPEIEKMAKAYGAHGFLRKNDLTGEILVAKIEEVLNTRRGKPLAAG